jgi:multisubunit Na+/H+ antiporter MnhF subunit
VRKLAALCTTNTCLWVVGLAFLWDVVELVWRSSMIERLVSIDAVVPVVVLRFVRTELCLVPVDVEYDWVNCFEVVL